MAQSFQVGVIEPFDGDDFTDYSERLESYFIANNIGQVAEDASDTTKRAANKKKVAATISVPGKKAYSTLKDLCLPDLPSEKTYEQIKEILSSYYKPKVLEVVESYRFHQSFQDVNESVIEYANKLQRLAVHCNFGPFFAKGFERSVCRGSKK